MVLLLGEAPSATVYPLKPELAYVPTKNKILGSASKPLSGGLTSTPLFPIGSLCTKIFGVGASEDVLVSP